MNGAGCLKPFLLHCCAEGCTCVHDSLSLKGAKSQRGGMPTLHFSHPGDTVMSLIVFCVCFCFFFPPSLLALVHAAVHLLFAF